MNTKAETTSGGGAFGDRVSERTLLKVLLATVVPLAVGAVPALIVMYATLKEVRADGKENRAELRRIDAEQKARQPLVYGIASKVESIAVEVRALGRAADKEHADRIKRDDEMREWMRSVSQQVRELSGK